MTELMNTSDLVDRRFLQELRDTAHKMCNPSLNPDWRQAYENLAAAADVLDAMEARCSVLSITSGRPLEIGGPDFDGDRPKILLFEPNNE